MNLESKNAVTTGRSDTRLLLARKGRSGYRIVLSATACAAEKRAAEELQRFLREISQVTLPIVSDDQPTAQGEIILGNNRRLAKLETKIDFAALGEDGFTLRTVGRHLVIAGGPVRGTLNGVYTFLENYLGCRWFSSKVSFIPRQAEISLGPIDDTQVPVLKYREVYYHDAMDPDFAARHKLNGNASITKDGRMTQERHRGWGTWCHTFAGHVPPDTYFAAHPEYFAMVNGQRVPNTQLCLTNPEVFTLVVADLKARMAAEPEAHYWSVSQNDTGGNCQCPNCRAIDEREGTPMGSLLEFVNKIAAKFPDKTLSTLSYQYSRRAPKTLRPARNVLIMLCSIECNRSRPLATDADERSFREDVQNWSRICDSVFIWDYVVQFGNLVSPFPNLRVLQPNLRFFVEHGAKGMFAQGNREVGGEFAELRAYLLAKLVWNPDCDVQRAMDDFLRGYYGAAAHSIREYIELLHDALERSGARMGIFGGIGKFRGGHLSPAMLRQYDALFDKAEQQVDGDLDVLLRVQTARMPLHHAQLQLFHGDLPARTRIVEKLFAVAQRVGLLMFNETSLPTERYRKQITESLEKEASRPTLPVPSPWQLAWQRHELIAFAHFGINTFTDLEWGDGNEDPCLFNPTDFDARQWAAVLQEAGVKLLILTAKHHDGFCLWPSRWTGYGVKNSPWRDGKGDVVREVVDALREKEIRVGLYLSPWDRNQPAYGDSPKYNEYFRNQLRELLGDYGVIDEVWFDGACGEGANGKRQEYDWPGYYALVRELQPEALIAICGPDIRWVGNEDGVARENESSVVSRDGRLVWHPAECDVSIRPGWFYHPAQDTQVKSLSALADIYFKSVGRNSVLLLNIPPDRRGRIADADAVRLKEFGAFVRQLHATDFVGDAVVTASSSLFEHFEGHVKDGDPGTFWMPADALTTGYIEFDLGAPKTFNVARIQEDISLGERVQAYHVEVLDGDAWRTVTAGQVIGHKQLRLFPAVTAQRVRLVIDKAAQPPAISEFGIHRTTLASVGSGGIMETERSAMGPTSVSD